MTRGPSLRSGLLHPATQDVVAGRFELPTGCLSHNRALMTRGGQIRTADLLNPIQARYQTTLRPDMRGSIAGNPISRADDTFISSERRGTPSLLFSRRRATPSAFGVGTSSSTPLSRGTRARSQTTLRPGGAGCGTHRREEIRSVSLPGCCGAVNCADREHHERWKNEMRRPMP